MPKFSVPRGERESCDVVLQLCLTFPSAALPVREPPARYVQISVPLGTSKSTVLAHLCFSTKLHSVMSQKTMMLTLSIVRTLKSHMFSCFRDEPYTETASESTENIQTLSLFFRKVIKFFRKIIFKMKEICF